MDIWSHIRNSLNPAFATPRRISHFEVTTHHSVRGGRYRVIKNPDRPSYLKLDDRDYFIWRNLDGATTVRELAARYLAEFGALALGRITNLLHQLEEHHFLTRKPTKLFSQIREQLSRHSFEKRLQGLKQVFFQKQFSITGIDGCLSWLYGQLVFPFFSRPAKALYVLLSAAGFVCFLLLFHSGEYRFLRTAGSYGLGLLTLLLISTVSICVHEAAHAFTTKAYGRCVTRGGFMFYLGLPCFFVDTSDIWMEPKGRRIAVSWAGPWSNLILGSVASLILYAFPGSGFGNVLFKTAAINFMICFSNLNPLLELDGYYMLLDWVEVPLLRKKSLHFLKNLLIKRTRPRGPFTAEEKLFTVFGLLAAFWTAVAVLLSLYLVQFRIARTVREILYGSDFSSRLFSVLAMLLIIIPIFLSLLAITYLGTRWFLLRLRKLTLWQHPRAVALLVLACILIVCGIPLLLSTDAAHAYHTLGAPGLLLCAIALGAREVRDRKGSRFEGLRAFTMFLLFVFLCASTRVGALFWPKALPWSELGPVLWVGSYAFLLLYLYQVFSGFSASRLSLHERVVIYTAPPIGLLVCLLAGTLFDLSPHRCFSALIGILSLGVFVPSLRGYYRSDFFLGFLSLDAGILLLANSLLWESVLLFTVAALFLTGSLLLYHAAQRRLRFALIHSEDTAEQSEKERLFFAVAQLLHSVLHDFSQRYGRRAAEALAQRVNRAASPGSMRVSLKPGMPHTGTIEAAPIVDLGDQLHRTLDSVMAEIVKTAGEAFARNVLVRARDTLFWKQRELADRHVLRHVSILGKYQPSGDPPALERRRLIASVPFFLGVPKHELDRLTDRFKTERAVAGQDLVREGEPGDTFYIIAEGTADVFARTPDGAEKRVASLARGDYFGELALLEGRPRTATVRSTSPMELLVLHKEDFDALSKEAVSLMQRFGYATSLNTNLLRSPLFTELREIQVAFLAKRMRQVACRQDDVIARQGETGSTFYVILKGRFSVELDQDDGSHAVVGQLGPGEYFGEIALLHGVPRTATVRAQEDGLLYALEKEAFDRILGCTLQTHRDLELVSSRRLHDLRSAGV